jgi:hypothetical protein
MEFSRRWCRVADGDRVRVEVGFEGGQVVGGFVDPGSADQLERALHEDGPRVVILELEDGRYHVVVPRVAYFRRFSRSSRVGFASG